MATEDKWKANLEKVAFIKQFPGLLGSWEALKGKTIEAVIPLIHAPDDPGPEPAPDREPAPESTAGARGLRLFK